KLRAVELHQAHQLDAPQPLRVPLVIRTSGGVVAEQQPDVCVPSVECATERAQQPITIIGIARSLRGRYRHEGQRRLDRRSAECATQRPSDGCDRELLELVHCRRVRARADPRRRALEVENETVESSCGPAAARHILPEKQTMIVALEQPMIAAASLVDPNEARLKSRVAHRSPRSTAPGPPPAG